MAIHSPSSSAKSITPYEQGHLRVEVSHPFAREKANGWGTEHLLGSSPIHLWPSLAGVSWAAQDDRLFRVLRMTAFS
jgi:hypothetical protein